MSVESRTVETSTTQLILFVTPRNIPIEIYEAGSATQLSGTCQVDVSGPNFYFVSLSWTANTGVQFTGASTDGFGSYEFVANCPGFDPSTTVYVVTASDPSVIILIVSAPGVVIEVRETATNNLITVGASIQISFGGLLVETFSYTAGITNEWEVTSGFGTYEFVTTAAGYDVSRETRDITTGLRLITLFVAGCGDGVCSDGETFDFCEIDCAALFLQFEQYDGNTPVNGYTVSLFDNDPRVEGQFGPERNGEVATLTRTSEPSSNTFYQATFEHDDIAYVEVVAEGFITFYWRCDLNIINPFVFEVFGLRGHLSPTLGASDLPYRIVNTWRTTDDEPPPYAPTDLNLHLFFEQGACDINNPQLPPLNDDDDDGFLRCRDRKSVV